jgi:sporulation protein YlmC with PRC-barrel domain
MDGLEVFTEDAMHVGSIEDVSVDPKDGKVVGLVLSRVEESFIKKIGAEVGKGVIVPYAAVVAVGDIVLIKNIKYEVPRDELA